VELSTTGNQIFSQPLHLHESLKFPLSHIKKSTHHLLGLNPHMTSIRCILRFAHSALNITKNNYRVCICGEMEAELHLFSHFDVHCAARTALHNNVHGILNETGFAEPFERLGHTELLRLYLYGVPDAPTAVSVASFNAVGEFLKCCNRF